MADLYAVLGVQRSATNVQIRRAYRTLCTRHHPDKGGDSKLFQQLQTAWSVLSDPAKRKSYDDTGAWAKSAGEEFVEQFSQGSYAVKVPEPTADTDVADQIILHQVSSQPGSHTAGFQAWMRSRGNGAAQVFDADAVATQFGVVQSSYQASPLEPCDVVEVICIGPGAPKAMLQVQCTPLPAALDWGEVLLDVQLAPVNPADLYTARLGGVYGNDCVEPPFCAGHDCIAIVKQVGPGVKHLQAGDLVMPFAPFMGTWRSKAVVSEKALVQVPGDLGLPLEYLAIAKEMCLAYALLETHARLLPGDCLILNAANSTVGQTIVQLCKLLKLRVVAVVRDASPRMVDFLKAIGATEVLKDEGSLKVELDKLKFFAKPKVALDSVGGESGLRLAEALAEEGQLLCFGCASGKPPPFTWQSFVFRELRVSGFNFRAWLRKDVERNQGARFLSMLRSVGKLVSANLLALNFTEYDLASELFEALDHALDVGKNTKVLLRGNGAPAVTATAE